MVANLLIIFFVVLLFLAAFILVRTIQFGKLPVVCDPILLDSVDGAVVAEHLAAVVRCQTISDLDPARIDSQKFLDLHRELQNLYPRVHTTLKVETVSRFSLLYTWEGKDPSLEPVLFAGHLDVVPVDPSMKDEWKHAPFGGDIADGFVWGRGTLDTKCTVVAVLDSVEALLREGYQPERTVMLAFGHDEEIGGAQGAAQIVAQLLARNVRLAAVIDEGGAVMTGMLPGVTVPTAMVGVAEKGQATLELLVEGRGGHSSMPMKHTSIGVLARAIQQLENHPLPAHFEMAGLMFRSLGPVLPFKMRMVFANLWLFGPFVRKTLSASPTTNAMIRTTTAVTMIDGGVKENVLPARAHAAVNFRLMPGERIADVVAHVRDVVHDDAVQFNLAERKCWEASPVSPVDSPAFSGLTQTICEVFPEAAVAPYLVMAATDSRHYAPVCEYIYRFSPYLLNAEGLSTIHGVNEHISVENLARMVQFYKELIKDWA